MYLLSEAADPQNIKEREWGTGAEIKFSTFTSCIGIIGKVGTSVIGVHLSIMDSTGNFASAQDMSRICDFLTEKGVDTNTSKVIGCISVWKTSNQGAWDSLIRRLEGADEYPLGEGSYGAKIGEAGVELTY